MLFRLATTTVVLVVAIAGSARADLVPVGGASNDFLAEDAGLLAVNGAELGIRFFDSSNSLDFGLLLGSSGASSFAGSLTLDSGFADWNLLTTLLTNSVDDQLELTLTLDLGSTTQEYTWGFPTQDPISESEFFGSVLGSLAPTSELRPINVAANLLFNIAVDNDGGGTRYDLQLSTDVQAVPSPGSTTLLLIGFATIACYQCRRGRPVPCTVAA